jgi:hypothetical protein
MKKVFRYLGITILVIIVLVGLLATVIAVRGIPSYKAEKIELKVTPTPQRIAQGQRLATMLCRNCHFDGNTGRFTGHRMDDIPQFGTIYSRNITSDKQHGIGNWTDGQLAYLLRTGLKPDGTYLPPYMPKLPHLSDEDLFSIIAFLRSEHPWVAPDPTEQPPSSPSFLTKMLTGLKVMKPFPYPEAPVLAPDTTNAVAWGKYIAIGQLDCYACHSKDFAKNDYLNPEKSEGFFGGGNEMSTASGKKITTLNLTMDEETGLGRWSEEEFIRAVKTGQVPHGEIALREPMAPYTMLSDKEARAIWAYLQTVPKIRNKVARSQ